MRVANLAIDQPCEPDILEVLVGTQRVECKSLLLHPDDKADSVSHFLASGTVENLVHLGYHVGIVGIQFVGDFLLILWSRGGLDLGTGINPPVLPPVEQRQFPVVRGDHVDVIKNRPVHRPCPFAHHVAEKVAHEWDEVAIERVGLDGLLPAFLAQDVHIFLRHLVIREMVTGLRHRIA